MVNLNNKLLNGSQRTKVGYENGNEKRQESMDAATNLISAPRRTNCDQPASQTAPRPHRRKQYTVVCKKSCKHFPGKTIGLLNAKRTTPETARCRVFLCGGRYFFRTENLRLCGETKFCIFLQLSPDDVPNCGLEIVQQSIIKHCSINIFTISNVGMAS